MFGGIALALSADEEGGLGRATLYARTMVERLGGEGGAMSCHSLAARKQ